MKIGTRSILFGVHQFAIHPWFVAWGWWQLYGFPWDPRLWIAFFVHDLGYWGKPNMDGKEGESHPYFGARIMGRLFDKKYPSIMHDFSQGSPCCQCGEDMNIQVGTCNLTANCSAYQYKGTWFMFCLHHSRFLARRHDDPFSKLCVADKLAIALTPAWLYLPMARATGELEEYMKGKGARTPAGDRSPREWFRDVQRYCKAWAVEHAEGKLDTWTGTTRDLAIDAAEAEEPTR